MLKKVAIMLTSVPESGGEHQYLLLLTEALKKYDGKYFSVIALCYNRYWVTWCKENRVAYRRLETRYYTIQEMYLSAWLSPVLKIYSSYFTELGKILTGNQVKILICGQQSIYVPQYLCKSIRLVHDIMHRYEPGFKEIEKDAAVREAIFKAGARVEDVVLVDSALGKRQFIESYYKKGHNPRIEILPFTASDNIKNAVEKYIDIPIKYIFYPAQFWEHKNHVNLLKAVEIVKRNTPDIHLVLTGSERNSLGMIKKAIEKYGLEKNVSIKGFVSDGQMKFLYQHAVALVMPTYFGPTNIPPLEAMTLGCPVIVSNKYAMGEQVGEAGLLFDPDSPEDMADSILKVWLDEDKRQAMMKAGFQRSKMWTAENFKKKFITIILRELGVRNR